MRIAVVGAHAGESAIGFLDEGSVGSQADFAWQRVVVCPSHLVVVACGKLVGHDAQEQRLAIFLIDGGREQAITVAADASHLEILNAIAVGCELAVAANGAYPAEGAHTLRGAQRSAGEEETAVAHRRHVGHFPEGAVLCGRGSLEEDGSIVAPRSAVLLVQGATAHTVLTRTHNDVFLTVGLEVVGVAEILETSGRCTVDDDALLVPFHQRLVGRRCLHDAGFRIVYARIENVGRAIIIEHAAAPATLDVVTLAGSNGNKLLAPVVEILAGDVPPVQARHVRAVGILLEEHMVAAVGKGHAVSLVAPAARWHAMELRAPQRSLVARCGIVEVGSLCR